MNPSATPLRILIVDDHPAMRQGMAVLVAHKGFVVAGEAEDPQEALEMVAAQAPDLVLVDLSLKDASGIDLLAALQPLGIPALVYTVHEEPYFIRRAFAAGALAYVNKCEVSHVLLEAIDTALAGRRYLSPQVARRLADQTLVEPGKEPIKPLSPREETVLRLLGEGAETARIAATLQVSARTVHTYYNRIIVKLGLDGMKDLRRLAVTRQL